MTKERIMKRFKCPNCKAVVERIVVVSTEIYPCPNPDCYEYAVAVEPENPHA